MPGTDGALAWALIGMLIEQGKFDREFVEHYSVGFEEAAEYAGRCTPEWASRITGLSEQEILTCAEMIAEGRPEVVNYLGVSLEHQENGVDTMRAIAGLGGLAGALDRKGGHGGLCSPRGEFFGTLRGPYLSAASVGRSLPKSVYHSSSSG